ncbi:MAG: von Willebrand factor type A domain-containing protein [Planctomycetes bacterium]|nr:von Willebrand factor type A domain-containing protein [Planctomycetota bacterium]
MQRPFLPVLIILGTLVSCSRPTDAPSPTPPPSQNVAVEPAETATPETAKPAPPSPSPTPPEAPAEEVVSEIESLTVGAHAADSEPATKESAFDSNRWNSAIGLGGGARGGTRGGSRARATAPPGTETYEHFDENGFVGVGDQPLSTFAIDVDGASWSNIRRFLESGRLPPADAVRVEECVNWFRYGDAAPAADAEHPIAVHTEIGACPWAGEHRLLRIALRTRDVEFDRLPPCNLVFLIDVSGSMGTDDKLPLLRRGLRLLVRQLRPQDHIAIVTYAGDARIALVPTSGSERDRIEAAIESLAAGGGTNGADGIRTAYDLVRQCATTASIDRVVLATDGDFNVGIADKDQLVGLIERERESGAFLSVLGFGTGNLKDATLESLGRHGNGTYTYVDSIAEARRVLVEQAGATLVTVAVDVKVQIEFNPRFVQSYRQIGYENRALAARDFNDDRKDAGEMGAGHEVTALYELVPVGAEPPVPAVDALRYQRVDAPVTEAPAAAAAASAELLTVKVRYKQPKEEASRRFELFVAKDAEAAAGDDFRFAVAVAAFAQRLHGSRHGAALALEDIAALASGARGEDRGGERAEFLRLVGMARDLLATEPGAR